MEENRIYRSTLTLTRPLQSKICSICQKEISKEKLVGFNDKDFHLNCFQCCQCSKSLLNETNVKEFESNMFCLNCYDQYFAARCFQCSKSILDGRIIDFNQKKYHFDCFRCQMCDQRISDEKVYLKDSKPICSQCRKTNLLPSCSKCLQTIENGKYLIVNENQYHLDCFQCSICHQTIVQSEYNLYKNEPCCLICYQTKILPKCYKCLQTIENERAILFNENQYHSKCFQCTMCNRMIDSEQFPVHDGKPYCSICHDKSFTIKCSKCLKRIENEQFVTSNENQYHLDCFRCSICHNQLNESKYYLHKNEACCSICYQREILPKCSKCSKSIQTKYTTFRGESYHCECFTCSICGKVIDENQQFRSDQSMIRCSNC